MTSEITPTLLLGTDSLVRTERALPRLLALRMPSRQVFNRSPQRTKRAHAHQSPDVVTKIHFQ